jgi:hypothetical protein
VSRARDAGRLPISLITYVGWTLVTVFGMRWAGDGTRKPLIESVTHGVSWNLVMAVAVCYVSSARSPQRHAARDGLAMPSPTLTEVLSGAHP